MSWTGFCASKYHPSTNRRVGTRYTLYNGTMACERCYYKEAKIEDPKAQAKQMIAEGMKTSLETKKEKEEKPFKELAKKSEGKEKELIVATSAK